VVKPRHDSAFTLAANLGVDAVQVAVVGLGGRVHARAEYRIDGVGSDPRAVARRLVRRLRALRAKAGCARLVGVGVGVPGVVRQADGFVEIAPNLQWQQAPFGDMLREEFGSVSVRVGNDGELGALAELVRGAGRGAQNLVYIAGEVGIGGGIVVDGRMVRGAGGYAGEIGHVVVDPDGRACRCGSRGCLETEAGEEALLRAAGLPADGGRAAVRRLVERARAGDPTAVGAVDHVAGWLGRGIAALVNVLNPELIIVGGPISVLHAVSEPALTAAIEAHSLAAARRDLRVVQAGLRDDSSLLGAAELAFETLLADPADAWVSRRSG